MSVAHALSLTAEVPAVPVDRDLFRDAMARLGAAVNIVTTDGPAGLAGFTATAVCSVSDTPPTLLVCLNRGASVHPAFSANGVLCVNVLAAGQQALANLFGGKNAMAERFAAADWTRLATGAPVLDGALVACDCRIAGVQSVGSHDLLLCEVLGVAEPGGTGGLLYFRRAYHELG